MEVFQTNVDPEQQTFAKCVLCCFRLHSQQTYVCNSTEISTLHAQTDRLFSLHCVIGSHEQDGQCTYNVTWRHSNVTTVAVEKQ